MKSPAPLPAAEKTRRRIIQAAEKLFAEKGFQAMTLREVTRQARVNLAAVNYHFGSKTALMREVIGGYVIPVNAERLLRLDALCARHAPGPAPVEAIFDSLIRPLFEQAAHSNFPQVVGRAMSEPAQFMREMHKEFFIALSIRYMQELQRSCPQLDETTIKYRYFLAVSTMIGTVMDQVRLENLFGCKLEPANLDKVVDELVQFVAAGFQQKG